MASVTIIVRNETRARPALSKPRIEKIAAAVKQELRHKGVLIFSVTFVSNQKIRVLNKKYRHKDKPTDILSFRTGEEYEAGDIFLAPEYIRKQLEKSKRPAEQWHTRLLIHGLLHLLGFTHGRRADFAKMNRIEEKIFRRFYPHAAFD